MSEIILKSQEPQITKINSPDLNIIKKTFIMTIKIVRFQFKYKMETLCVGLQQYIVIRKYWDTAIDNMLYCIGGSCLLYCNTGI